MSKLRPNPKGKAKTEAIISASPNKKIPVPSYPGLIIDVIEGPIEKDDDLHVWLSAIYKGRDVVTDPHFVFVNPPVDPTWTPADIRKKYESMIIDGFLNHAGHKL